MSVLKIKYWKGQVDCDEGLLTFWYCNYNFTGLGMLCIKIFDYLYWILAMAIIQVYLKIMNCRMKCPFKFLM